jgi:HK97 family phage major capsid protein
MASIEEHRQAHELATQRMEELALQLDNLPDNVDTEVAVELDRRFQESMRDAEKAKEQWNRAELIAQARSKTLPPASESKPDKGSQPAARTLGNLSPAITVQSEEKTYRPDNGNGNFFFRDLYRAMKAQDQGAQARIQRARIEMMVESRDLSSTDGVGGDFVLPTYLMQDWTEVIRMGRPFANAVNNAPLPDNTDTISWPRVLTGSSVAAQADLGAVSETDPSTGMLSVPVKTLAGQIDVSQQLLDRSQPGIDQVLFADLRADYNLRIDLQAISGSGSGANAKGVLSDSSRTQVTYTDASPTVAEFYSKIMDASQRILTARGLPADTLVVHPRRWAWIAAASDSAGRPLIPPVGAAQNSPGQGGVVDLGNPGFNLAGLRVIIDANLPTNQGTGTNEDVAIVMRAADVMLWERANPVTRVHDQVLDANLAVRLQLFNYFAFSTERYSPAVATIGGTGLIAPTF